MLTGLGIDEEWPPLLAAFFASQVTAIEAGRAVLAVPWIHSRRRELVGKGLVLLPFLALLALLPVAVSYVPQDVVQLILGTLLAMFGLRWLREAILNASGIRARPDQRLATFLAGRGLGADDPWSRGGWFAVVASAEVLFRPALAFFFVLCAIGAADNLWLPLSMRVVPGVVLVVLLIRHQTLQRFEIVLKFAAAVLLSAVGTFWTGHGIGIEWAAEDGALLALIGGFLLMGLLLVPLARSRLRTG